MPLALLLILPAACKSAKKYDLIEAELRTRERELGEARAELEHARLLNDAYARGAARPPAAPASCPPGGSGAPTLPLKSISLGNGSGGIDDDNQPGDEALQVVIVPHDDDGSAVKVPARAGVQAWEVTREGLKVPIGTWEVSPEQLRRAWRNGLFASGFFVTLQWDKPPATERIRVAVRLTTLDGRAYEADKDVTVRPLPGLQQLPQVGPPAGPTVLPPPAVEQLPAPSFRPPAARLLPPQAEPRP